VPGNTALYNSLQSAGYVLVFKETFAHKDGNIKGNCDAELVLQAMIDIKEYEQAVIVSGDGDFTCLVEYLRKKNKLLTVLAPNNSQSSWLLRKVAKEKYTIMDNLRSKIEYKKV
jgi:uncharacterized LabA/DUF88 family protein